MNILTKDTAAELLQALKNRFEQHMQWHAKIKWSQVASRLETHPEKLWSLSEMERTGGEPDVVGVDPITSKVTFMDCSPESPQGRRSLCYDQAALESRKTHKPVSSAVGMATEMGIELLTEQEYHDLQKLGPFDVKTSSWIQTPVALRKLGGALFGDCRYDRVFIYHNGAESYYASRGFRGKVSL